MSTVAVGMPNIDDARKDRLEKFAPYVAPLPWFTIDILHKLYINIYVRHAQINDEYKIRAITCSDLLFSPAVTKVGYNVFMFRPEVQEELRGIINPQKEILEKIGTFMLAYITECKPHFLGLKYVESFRIEGNLILNPVAEASRISNHIVNRLNQIRSFDQKKNTVAYYLDILQRPDLAPEQKELIQFLQGYDKYDDRTGELPAEWKTLQNKTNETSMEGIPIKLPYHVRERILKEIQKAGPSKDSVQSFHALFIGINEYAYRDNYALEGAVNDAENVAAYLTNHSSGKFKYQSTVLLDLQATKAGILSAIQSLCAQAKEGDIVLFYFAGYGGNESASSAVQSMMNENVMPAIPEDQPILICHDTVPDTKPALGINEVMFAFSPLPKDCQCIFVFDCGFHRQEVKGGYKARSLAEDVTMRRPDQWVLQPDSNIPAEQDWSGYTIYASEEYQNVFETLDGGIFTRSLLEALKKNQNNITFEDLLREVQSAIVVPVMLEPRIVPHGNYNMQNSFLFGFLKEGESVEKRIEWATKTKSEKLDISGLNLTEIPVGVFELPFLKELNLSRNQIKEIPERIDSLRNLEQLDISSNPITRIDEAVGQLENLSLFKAQECGLNVFPYMLLQCKSMRRVDLQKNNIKWAPIEIKDFHPDTQVVLLENQILNLPEEFYLSQIDRFKSRYSEWQTKPAGQQPVAILIGFDYENNLKYLNEEIGFVENALKEAGADVKALFNPNAEDLYRILYEHQEQMTILHIGANKIDKILVGQGSIREINEQVVVDLFRCIRRSAFPAKLAFFNYCNSDVIISELMPGSFACAIGAEDVVDDRTAFKMSREFYNGMLQGQQLEESFANSLINNARER